MANTIYAIDPTDHASVITNWTLRMRVQLHDLLDYRDLAQDLWDGPKVLIDKSTSAIAAGRHDVAEFLLTSAQWDLDRLAALADDVHPLADPDDTYWSE